MRVLLVEDDEQIASFVEAGLREAGFAVDRVGAAEEALELTGVGHYDAAVIDIMLPGMDGVALVELLRGRGDRTPVLILSARQSIDDKTRAFHRGGDDYLTKPFSFSELLVRVQALIRRAGMSAATTRLEVGELSMDLLTREVRRAGKLIELQPREFALLEYLMRNAGNVVTRTMILERVWDYHFDPQTNVVDVLVSRLRNKIDKGFERKMIRTVRGVGYVLQRA